MQWLIMNNSRCRHEFITLVQHVNPNLSIRRCKKCYSDCLFFQAFEPELGSHHFSRLAWEIREQESGGVGVYQVKTGQQVYP